MSRLPLQLIAIAVLFAVVVVVNSAFIVPETRSALVFRFGEPKSKYTTAGLRFKLPFAESVSFIDKRNRNLEQAQTEIIARNQERLIVDAFARYRIIEPLLFYQSVRTESSGEDRLGTQFEDSIRAVLGEVTVDEIISERRGELMLRIRDQLTRSARPLGVEIIDVKIRRADLPQTNSEAVFQRMIAERRQLAQQYRSEGNEQANQIRAQADRQVIEIKAQAEEEDPKNSKALPMVSATRFLRPLMARMRSFSPSIARCLPMKNLYKREKRRFCFLPTANSSAISIIWKAVASDLKPISFGRRDACRSQGLR